MGRHRLQGEHEDSNRRARLWQAPRAMQLRRSVLYTKAAVTSNETSRPQCCSCKPAARLLLTLLQITPLQAVKQDLYF